MFEKIKSDTQSSMDKSIDNFKSVLSKIRAGRPNPSILDQVIVDYLDLILLSSNLPTYLLQMHPLFPLVFGIKMLSH